IIFSDGVIGNITKKQRISAVIKTKLPQDMRVIFVDFLRLPKDSEILRIKKHTPVQFSNSSGNDIPTICTYLFYPKGVKKSIAKT
ncbi:MAG: hypothetical protein IIZ18_05695, partial [Ruminococcus sp.]|nr:hypothetical protein [Ruminococcus sp.]